MIKIKKSKSSLPEISQSPQPAIREKRAIYDWMALAQMPHIIKPVVINTTPKKRSFRDILKAKHYETMPFGKFSKTSTDNANRGVLSNMMKYPYLRLEELPKSYIIWCLENCDRLDLDHPGLEDQLREVLERQNNHTLSDNEGNNR